MIIIRIITGDWLLALPIVNCELRLDNEAVRMAVDLRLGLSLCAPHKWRCGAEVDAHGIHVLVCKRAPGRTIRHHVLNEIIWCGFSSAGIPATNVWS